MSTSNIPFETGLVKFFDKKKGFGFIIPDDKEPGEEDIHFWGDSGVLLTESFWGEIALGDLGPISPLPMPETGDEILYEMTADRPYGRLSHRGPHAHIWSYMGYYRRALRIIERRLKPTDPSCRVLWYPPHQKPITVWQSDSLEDYSSGSLLKKHPELLPEFIDNINRFEFQNLLVGGWSRCSNGFELELRARAIVAAA